MQSLDSARQAPQLHAGLRLLLSRLAPAVRKTIHPQLVSWNTLCVKTAPPVLSSSDRISFMTQFWEVVQLAPSNID